MIKIEIINRDNFKIVNKASFRNENQLEKFISKRLNKKYSWREV